MINVNRRTQRAQRSGFLPRLPMYWLVVSALTQSMACQTATTTIASRDSGAANGADAAAGAANGTTAPTADWCAVKRVLEDKCQRCHSQPPLHGAPFALVSYADTQALDQHGRARYLAMAQALEDALMPPSFIELDPPVQSLSPAELETLLDFCQAGAPAGDGNCADP